MQYGIKDALFLKKIVWVDFFLGSTSAVAGLLFFKTLSTFLGLSVELLLIISVITLLYSFVAFTLAIQKNTFIPLLRTLIYANWFWTLVSVVLFFLHTEKATLLGQLFLFLQIVVVGGLAYLEGKQVVRKPLDVIN